MNWQVLDWTNSARSHDSSGQLLFAVLHLHIPVRVSWTVSPFLFLSRLPRFLNGPLNTGHSSLKAMFPLNLPTPTVEFIHTKHGDDGAIFHPGSDSPRCLGVQR